MPTEAGVDLLGYHVFPYRRRLRNDNGHRFARKLRRFAQGYAEGKMAWQDFDASVQSWIGHGTHGETEGLRKVLFGRTVFVKGADRRASRV